MYKTETHLHLAEISLCSRIRAGEMIKLYYEAGYKTVFVSDHFKQAFFDSLGDIPYKDKITIFMSGYYKAKHAGEKYGMNILPSLEFSVSGSCNHYLLYGITKEFLCEYPNLCSMELPEFYKVMKDNNIFVVQAHPFRDGRCYPTPQFADAVEIYNSNPRHDDFNDKAEKTAKDNSLPATAGSDAHRLEDVGLSGIITECEIKSTEEYIEIIKSGNFQLIKEQT